ncbi:MAG: site-specific integrase [Polyangiaceae bacterium]|nr:site-specific integrase [Polyangiaceae bacterium]
MTKKKWVLRWNYMMESSPVRTGVYRLQDGGFFIRARLADETGKPKDLSEVAHDLKTADEAQRRRDAIIAEARAEMRGEPSSSQLWGDFAVSLLEARVAKGNIESAATIEWWQNSLEHYLLPAFGRHRATEITRAHIDTWITKTVLPWMKEGRVVQRMRNGKPFGQPRVVKLKPAFVNGLLRIVRNVSNEIALKFDMPKSAFIGIDFLPEGRVYTREQPNSLPPEMVHRFLDVARSNYPQHYFMILLGFVTGLRPSSMRALRRKGPHADLDWTTGELQVRRSHSRGHSVMDRTKTKIDNTFTLPTSVLDEAKRHVAALPEGKATESDLLFPTKDGNLRTRNVLAKPFAAIAEELGLSMRVTPRAMRRTFNDLTRAVGVDAVVTRSISGHQTEAMQLHYSTARACEQIRGLEKVHAVVNGGAKNQGAVV